MKNMRIFFEQWSSEFEANRQLPTADLSIDDGLAPIRQLPTAELGETKMTAFCRVGFTHRRRVVKRVYGIISSGMYWWAYLFYSPQTKSAYR